MKFIILLIFHLNNGEIIAYKSFPKDVKIGNKAETACLSLLINAGWQCEKAPKACKEYDFLAQKDIYTILFEIKNDRMTSVTGNLAFEFWNPKKNEPSGLLVSKADFWVYCFGSPLEIHIVELPILKRYIEDTKPKKIIDVGGDKNASLYLYDREQIITDIFWRIDTLEPNNLDLGIKAIVCARNQLNTLTDVKNFEKGL